MNQKKKLTDLLKDASFLRWLRAGRPGNDHDWDAWSKEDPENEGLAEDASAMEQGIPFREQEVPREVTNDHWAGIQARLNDQELPNRRRSILQWSVAATILLLIGAFVFQPWKTDEIAWTSHQTIDGQTETIALADGSIVYLGANSSLQYATDFLAEDERRIYLDGEAFFDVQPLEEPKPFQVYTTVLNIRVLGTQFNINAHRSQPVVSLSSGSLQVIHPEKELTKILEPGQTAQFDAEQGAFSITTGYSDYWASWRTGEWQFGDGMPMTEVILRIEETYGLKCVVKDPTILQYRPAGKVSVDDREVLFASLSALMDLTFKVEGNELYIQQSEK